MRRKDKERPERAFQEQVLQEAETISVAFAPEAPGEAPYVLLLNFAWHDGGIVVHCAREGQKMEYLRHSPLVGFTAAVGVEVLREEATTRYRSVCGTARVSLVEDAAAKQAALLALNQRYATNCPVPTPEKALAKVAVLRLDILTMTGKQSPAQG